MSETTKRPQSVLIPYKIENGKIFVYLQKRSKDAKRPPDYFGFFGGGIKENETKEQGLLREIKEELDYVPKNYKFLGSYERARSVNNAFYMEVSKDFEKNIIILEGDYGKYFSEQEIFSEEKFIDDDKIVLRDFFKIIKK